MLHRDTHPCSRLPHWLLERNLQCNPTPAGKIWENPKPKRVKVVLCVGSILSLGRGSPCRTSGPVVGAVKSRNIARDEGRMYQIRLSEFNGVPLQAQREAQIARSRPLAKICTDGVTCGYKNGWEVESLGRRSSEVNDWCSLIENHPHPASPGISVEGREARHFVSNPINVKRAPTGRLSGAGRC